MYSPSGPKTNPELTASIVPISLMKKSFISAKFGVDIPLRYAFTSGIPDPTAAGDTRTQSDVQIKTIARL